MPGTEYERLSDGAHLAVVLAERAARLAGHEVVSVEHLLVALVESDDDVRARLAAAGIEGDALRDRVAEWSLTGIGSGSGAGAQPAARTVFSSTLRRTVQLAGRLATQDRSTAIEGRHLLQALLEVEDEFVLRVLISLGADPGAMRRRPRFGSVPVDGAVADADAPRPRRSLFALLTGR